MKKILSDIQDGTFAKEFLLDMSDAGPQVHFKAMRKLAAEHPVRESRRRESHENSTAGMAKTNLSTTLPSKYL